MEPNITYSEDSVPELVTVKSRFQNIRSGFIGLLANKKEELKQEIATKVTAPTQSLSNQVKKTLTQVKSNIKDANT